MKRRAFTAMLGGAAAWPLAARAQQGPRLPVIGVLHTQTPEAYAEPMRAFRRGLKEGGYVEGDNVSIEYRWAENQVDRLPELAAELVRRRVAVIAATGGIPSVLAARQATTAIPILFVSGNDPVKLGLVPSLARPGGNVTGVNFFAVELTAKRLELLRELMPAATRIALLVNPASPEQGSSVTELETAARAIGLQVRILTAGSSREISAAFANMARERPDALIVGAGPPFNGRRIQLAHLASYHRIPTIYSQRQNVEIGGLMSYGASLTDAYRQIGLYAGRILKGEKPADLPVVQSTKFELVINAETARMLGIDVPQSLLARADEVIE
jgi:putative tryptophan/tyrosine transport system substrate-binding protein